MSTPHFVQVGLRIGRVSQCFFRLNLLYNGNSKIVVHVIKRTHLFYYHLLISFGLLLTNKGYKKTWLKILFMIFDLFIDIGELNFLFIKMIDKRT